jgi:ribosome-associated protein
MPVTITATVRIPERELTFAFSRSAKPGGQNVNKVNTRVTLSFDVRGSASLTDAQKERITVALAGRMTADGILQVVAQEHRTQAANRRAAMERFASLLAGALRTPKRRRPTRPGRGAVERRLRAKSRKSGVKSGRSWRPEGGGPD